MIASDRETRIKVWMLENSVRQADIARQIGVSRQFLSRWVKGCRKSRKVREHFLSLGCPQEIVDQEPGHRQDGCED